MGRRIDRVKGLSWMRDGLAGEGSAIGGGWARSDATPVRASEQGVGQEERNMSSPELGSARGCMGRTGRGSGLLGRGEGRCHEGESEWTRLEGNEAALPRAPMGARRGGERRVGSRLDAS